MTATLTPAKAGPVEPAQVEMILAQIDSLPTLPTVAMRLLERTSDSTSSTREVIDLIESDQSLAARILSTVRRADVGVSATTVERAVILLGFDAIRSLVLSIQVFETFSRRSERAESRLDRVGLWRHSLAVGCAARLLAEVMLDSTRKKNGTTARPPAFDGRVPQPEEMFVCGLLHDIGKVALDACFPKSYDRVVAATDLARGSITDVERRVFGLDHTIAGQHLAAHWRLPDSMRESIWLHHHTPASTPTRINHAGAVMIVQVADRIVRELRIGYSGNYLIEEPAAQVARSMGLAPEVVEQVVSRLPAMIQERAELIGLDRLTSQDVYKEALVGANEELGRLNTVLSEANRRLEHRSRGFESLSLLSADQSEQPTHDGVCRAGAGAACLLAPGRPVALLGSSRSRGISMVAVCGGEKSARLEVIAEELAIELSTLPDGCDHWTTGSLIPAGVRDRLSAMMGEPPNWCRPIRWCGRTLGLLAVGGEVAPVADDSFRALCSGIAGWMNAAESAAEARRLNEELAEMNRLLVSTQAQVARMRSLAMVGEMAAGAAHELNNPLAVISGRAQLLVRDDQNEDVRRSAATISEHAHRASAIVSELMDFAKPPAPRAASWSPLQMLQQLRQEWVEKGSLSEHQFELALSDDVPEVHADASQIKILFDEVLSNAVQAMRAVARPLVVVNCQADLTDEKVVIRIQDNGHGMTAEVAERAMDPFFSYRPAGRGRGLGLSRAARYAEINGGRVRLSSVPGEGTTVVVELPTS